MGCAYLFAPYDCIQRIFAHKRHCGDTPDLQRRVLLRRHIGLPTMERPCEAHVATFPKGSPHLRLHFHHDHRSRNGYCRLSVTGIPSPVPIPQWLFLEQSRHMAMQFYRGMHWLRIRCRIGTYDYADGVSQCVRVVRPRHRI